MAKVKCLKCGKFLPKDYVVGGGVLCNIHTIHYCHSARDKKGRFRKYDKYATTDAVYKMYLGLSGYKEMTKILNEEYDKLKMRQMW